MVCSRSPSDASMRHDWDREQAQRALHAEEFRVSFYSLTKRINRPCMLESVNTKHLSYSCCSNEDDMMKPAAGCTELEPRVWPGRGCHSCASCTSDRADMHALEPHAPAYPD